MLVFFKKGQRAKSKGQRAEGKGQRAKSKGQRAKGKHVIPNEALCAAGRPVLQQHQP
jgi:hypothetical protein